MSTGCDAHSAVTLEELRQELKRFAHGELRRLLDEAQVFPTNTELSWPVTSKPFQPFGKSCSIESEEGTMVDVEEDFIDEKEEDQTSTSIGFRRHDWFETSYPTRVEGPHQQGHEDNEEDAHQWPLLPKERTRSGNRMGIRSRSVVSNAQTSRPSLKRSKTEHEAEEFYSHIHQHKAMLAQAKRHREASGLERILLHRYFEVLMATIVVFNAGLVGFEANRAQAAEMSSNHAEEAETDFTVGLDFFCAVFFTAELMLRISAHGLSFFRIKTWRWNVFDTAILFFQWMYLAVLFFPRLEMPIQMAVVRMLRFVRIVRIFRLVRFLSELQLIVKSIRATVTGVAWALLLLMVIVYVCSVLFLQAVSVHHSAEVHPHIERWFGGLFRTMLTLIECIFGGVGWDEVINPLVSNISPLLGVAFVIYVSVSICALLNLVTGLFVEKVTQTVRTGRDNDLARHICELFIKDIDEDHELGWEEFAEKMKGRAMQDFFKAIEVDPSDAKDFFAMLDTNNSGTVNAEEIVNGCLRLRGQAKSLDMAILIRAVDNIEATLVEISGRGRAGSVRGSFRRS